MICNLILAHFETAKLFYLRSCECVEHKVERKRKRQRNPIGKNHVASDHVLSGREGMKEEGSAGEKHRRWWNERGEGDKHK